MFVNSLVVLLAVIAGVTSFKFSTGEKQIVQDEKENKSESCEQQKNIFFVFFILICCTYITMYSFVSKYRSNSPAPPAPGRRLFSLPFRQLRSTLKYGNLGTCVSSRTECDKSGISQTLPYSYASRQLVTLHPTTVNSACPRNGRI